MVKGGGHVDVSCSIDLDVLRHIKNEHVLGSGGNKNKSPLWR